MPANTLGLIIGRFQPLHKGHMQLIKESLKDNPATLIFIGSTNKEGSENPYSFEKRKEFIAGEFPEAQPHLGISSPGGEEGKNMRYLYNQVPEYIKTLSKELRNKQTPQEDMLWSFLRNRKFHNLKFRRQHAIGRYIADFYCDEKKLIIELDGKIHEQQKEYDNLRDTTIQAHGISIIRIKNSELEASLEQMYSKLENTLLSLSLLKEREFKSEVDEVHTGKISIGKLPDFPDDIDWIAHILLHIPERITDCQLYCGDQENDYAVQVLQQNKAILPFTLHVKEIDRTLLPISGTQIREDMKKNDTQKLQDSLGENTFQQIHQKN